MILPESGRYSEVCRKPRRFIRSRKISAATSCSRNFALVERPRFCFFRIFCQSSRSPMAPKTSANSSTKICS